jgi:hypothetical protein
VQHHDDNLTAGSGWFAIEAGFLSLARRYADVGVLWEESPQEQGSPPGD